MNVSRSIVAKYIQLASRSCSYLGLCHIALTTLSVHLTGSKLGCGEGGCGACTVMVSSYDREEDVIKHVAVNACLTPLCSVAGMAITTVEGIGSTRTSLHPVQVRSYRKSSVLHSDLNNLCFDANIVLYTAPFRSVLPGLMGLSVDSVLLGLSCPCTLCSGTTPHLQRRKLRLLLRVSFRV